jgi:hypothetical protein
MLALQKLVHLMILPEHSLKLILHFVKGRGRWVLDLGVDVVDVVLVEGFGFDGNTEQWRLLRRKKRFLTF